MENEKRTARCIDCGEEIENFSIVCKRCKSSICRQCGDPHLFLGICKFCQEDDKYRCPSCNASITKYLKQKNFIK